MMLSIIIFMGICNFDDIWRFATLLLLMHLLRITTNPIEFYIKFIPSLKCVLSFNRSKS